MYGRFLSDLRISRLSDDYLKKEITLCRAGVWLNDIGVRWTSNRFCQQPSWGISSFIRAGLWVWPYRQVFALMEQTSRKPVLGTVLEWFRRLAPNKFGEPTRTLAEHACCRAEGHRAIMMSDSPACQLYWQPTWGLSSIF